jgi:hypothetical protein
MNLFAEFDQRKIHSTREGQRLLEGHKPSRGGTKWLEAASSRPLPPKDVLFRVVTSFCPSS